MVNGQQHSNDKDYIIIPNPIYDVVFRYLMQDDDSAVIILSTLINEKIIKLDFRPVTHAKKKTEEENRQQIEELKNKRLKNEKNKILADSTLAETEKAKKISEITIKDPATEKDIKLVHLDFTAIIELPDGTQEMVMIELQKAENESDVFRFREYIAENLTKKRKVEVLDTETNEKKMIEIHYRLIPIFILNFTIEHEIKDLMIRTKQLKTGVFTDKCFDKKNRFIEELSYEIYIAQLPYLHEIDRACYENDEYKSKLYALLKLFDQQAITHDNDHRLRLARKIFPKSLDRVLKRLQTAAIDNPDLEKQMKAEDAYTNVLKDRDNKIGFYKLKYKEAEKQLDNKAKQLDSTAKQLDNTAKQLDSTAKQLEEKNKLIIDLAKTLKDNNVSIDIIIEKTNLTKETIEGL